MPLRPPGLHHHPAMPPETAAAHSASTNSPRGANLARRTTTAHRSHRAPILESTSVTTASLLQAMRNSQRIERTMLTQLRQAHRAYTCSPLPLSSNSFRSAASIIRTRIGTGRAARHLRGVSLARRKDERSERNRAVHQGSRPPSVSGFVTRSGDTRSNADRVAAPSSSRRRCRAGGRPSCHPQGCVVAESLTCVTDIGAVPASAWRRACSIGSARLRFSLTRATTAPASDDST